MMSLTERQKLILALIVREYVNTVDPVSSRTLVEGYRLDFSSATVRNEMVVLTENGYLQQPYTTAGRAPTAMGYRYFVRQLMRTGELPGHVQQTIRHQFYQARHDVDDWLALAVSVLARHTNAAALVTPLRAEKARFKHLELVATRGRQVLLVLVLEGGEVRQQTLVLEKPISQRSLSAVAAKLNGELKGLGVEDIASRSTDDKVEQEALRVILDEIESSESVVAGEIYRDGLTNVLSEPEFSDPEVAQTALRIFEERLILDDVLSRTVFGGESGGIHVLVGGENTWHELKKYSLVLAQYGSRGQSMGAVGVLGPLRMDYGRMVSTVRFISDMMSEVLAESMIN
ncbi:MAG: heat-inducible transcription repressor HrcA [Anaerolineaceae bacterium 4572_5.1]|nr:MAG: heat-inducible transcription repressor HrcA [Anaerolineaceae bacterium 4572_5.1]RLD08409.1 MAG: heat-inducible transcription repressor HrcA [Chloroflexota bacterium]